MRLAAARSGLTVDSLEFGAPAEGLPTDLVGASMWLRAEGPEKALSEFLAAVSTDHLPIYPDEVEVKRVASRLSFELKGRLLCRRGLQ